MNPTKINSLVPQLIQGFLSHFRSTCMDDYSIEFWKGTIMGFGNLGIAMGAGVDEWNRQRQNAVVEHQL